MRQIVPLLIAVACMAPLACVPLGSSPVDRTREPVAVQLPPAAYFWVAWAGADRLATTLVTDTHSRILIADTQGNELRRVEMPPDPACIRRTPVGLASLPTGELGFAARCISELGDQPSELFAYDPTTDLLRSLGVTSQPAAELAWARDMSRLIYTAEGSLCSTLFERADDEGPLQQTVVIGGREVPLGEDLPAADNRCTQRSNARWPAHSPDGRTLATIAAAVSVSGPARVDQPWAVVLVEHGQATTILEGIRYPRGLAWLSDQLLVFTGQLVPGGPHGLWTMRRDGSELTMVGRAELSFIAADSDYRVVALVDDEDLSRGPSEMRNELVVYDLSDLR